MRILTVGNMYPPHHLGGYELMWASSVGQLESAGHEVRVLTTDFRVADPDPGVAAPGDVRRELRWYWHEHRFPRLSLRERLALERHNQEALARHINERKPEVVAWWAMGGMSASMIERVRRTGPPAVGVVVDDWLTYAPRVDQWQRAFGRPGLAGLAERATGVPTRLALDDAARWLFVSETTLRRARDAGVAPRRCDVAHAGIDPALFPPAPEREWGWDLLYLGRIDERKGIATAIRSLAELPAEATLRVVGGGDEEYLGELEELIAELGVSRRVKFESHPRDRLAAVYAEADAVVFPVLWEEPFGLVPLEAMSVGRPVIATGTGGSGEYLRDGHNSLIFQPRDDPAALAAAVRELAGDAGLRRDLREHGFATAARHTEDRFNGTVERLLAEEAGAAGG